MYEAIVQGGGSLTQPFGCTAWGLANRSEWNCPQRGCGYYGYHAGIDIAARGNPLLLAVGYGRVLAIGRLGGYCGGLGAHAVAILSGGVVIWYGHADAHYVNPGQLVTPGQALARMDSLGCSTGTHVHYEVMPLGGSSGCDALNPVNYLTSWPGSPPVQPAPTPAPAPAPVVTATVTNWGLLAGAGVLLALAARRR